MAMIFFPRSSVRSRIVNVQSFVRRRVDADDIDDDTAESNGSQHTGWDRTDPYLIEEAIGHDLRHSPPEEVTARQIMVL